MHDQHKIYEHTPVLLFRKVLNKFLFPGTYVDVFSALVFHFIYKISSLDETINISCRFQSVEQTFFSSSDNLKEVKPLRCKMPQP